jgi:hypothetical protein
MLLSITLCMDLDSNCIHAPQRTGIQKLEYFHWGCPMIYYTCYKLPHRTLKVPHSDLRTDTAYGVSAVRGFRRPPRGKFQNNTLFKLSKERIYTWRQLMNATLYE